MPVTEQQARALTFLASACRPVGAPRWDEAGIYANVMKVADRTLSTVVIAVMQAAEDRNAQSPGVIPTPGPHWRNPEAAPTREPHEAFNPDIVCHVCSQVRPKCRERWADDHDFLPVSRRYGVRSTPVPDEIRKAAAGNGARAAQNSQKVGSPMEGTQ